ncbi:MAG: S8 family serine peptidase, partial [Ferruginibacter sp.]
MYQFIPVLKKEKILLIVLCLVHLNTFSQTKPGKGEQDPFLLYADTENRSYTKENLYYLILWKEEMPASIRVTRMVNEKTAVIKILTGYEFESLSKQFTVLRANNQWKYSPALEKSMANLTTVQAGKKQDALESFIISAVDIDELQFFLKARPNEVGITGINKPSNSMVITCGLSFIKNTIAALNGVIFIDRRAEPHTEIGIIGYRRDYHGINQLDYLIPSANGKNITVGVKEQRMEELDLDLWKRVVPSTLAAPNITNHATVISSIIGGAGNSFYNGRGIANGCKFYSSSFSNLFCDDAAVLNNSKVTVQNHSYGSVVQQFYGAEAVSYDLHTWQNKNFVHVFSAGNSGKLAATEGKYAGLTNYANLTGNFKMAKNIIAVAAIDNAGNIPAESSSGPAYDGRLTPQLTALGPNGTSDAAAVISGTVAVMQQVYADSNSQVMPPASLVKAILFNTADDIYKTGIDYKTGYGLVYSYGAVRSLQQKNYEAGSLSQNQSWTKNITLPANTAQFKITLAWTDTVAQVNNNKALINDLDMELTELSTGNIIKPWVLSSVAHIDSLAKLPFRKRDSLNTAEQISIQLPNAGNYQVKVTGTI